MQIEEQIAKLLRVKAKIDLYKTMVENLKAELNPEHTDFKESEKANPGLLKEFVDEVIQYCYGKINTLGNTSPVSSQIEPKAPESAQTEPKPAAKPQPPVEDPLAEPKDPLKFLLKYKHLDNKRVTFETKDGTVTGTVKGLITPFIRVQTDSGFVVNIEPKMLKAVI